jgi:hydrogenase expression/formation protein HypC
MRVISINGWRAQCEAKGIERDVNLFLLQDGSIECGDFVMVHVGYAIQKVESQAASSAWQAYDAMLAAGGDAINDEVDLELNSK